MFAKEVCLLNTWNFSGQTKRKKVDQSADQRREERRDSSAWLSPFSFSQWSVLLPHTSRLHYLAPLSAIWDVISKYKFSFRYLGLRKAKTKHKVWNVLFHSPKNSVTEPEVSNNKNLNAHMRIICHPSVRGWCHATRASVFPRVSEDLLSPTPLSRVSTQLSMATDQWQNTHPSYGPSSHLFKRRTDLGLYMSEKEALDMGLIPSASSTLALPHFNTLYGDQLLFSGDLWDVLASLLLPEAFYQNHVWLCGDQFSGAVT